MTPSVVQSIAISQVHEASATKLSDKIELKVSKYSNLEQGVQKVSDAATG